MYDFKHKIEGNLLTVSKIEMIQFCAKSLAKGHIITYVYIFIYKY